MIYINRNDFEKKEQHISARYHHLLNLMTVSEINQNYVTYDRSRCFLYYKLEGIGDQWSADNTTISKKLSTLFVGLHSVGAPFSMIIHSDGRTVDFYYGTSNEYEQTIYGMISGIFPSSVISRNENGNPRMYLFENLIDKAKTQKFCRGGFLRGDPSGGATGSPIDSVLNGLADREWIYVIHAVPAARRDTLHHQEAWLREASDCSIMKDVSFSETDNLENIVYKKTYHTGIKYNDLLDTYAKKYTEAVSMGEWITTIHYAAPDDQTAGLLAGLLVTSYYGEESVPEPVHSMRCTGPFRLVNGLAVNVEDGILSGFQYPTVSSYLTGAELAVYASLPSVDTTGFSVRDYVAFDVFHNRTGELNLGMILKNGKPTDCGYMIPYNALNRHALIVGLTGSGKTNTTKNILYNIREGSGHTVPIMVIEPAKKEYWELYKLGFDDLQIYSVGSSDPKCNAYCLNPFERIGNTSLQTHIDNVFSAFKASFIMYTPMPYVLEKVIYEIYDDYGWDIRDNSNRYGISEYPTVEDMYFKIPEVVISMGYDQKMKNDLIGSLQARINSLRLGSKGDTLNVRKSFPIDKITSGNVVIELEDIGDDDVKAFIISMLLIQLAELRRQSADSQLEVKHILLIEEAHRLLKNVSSGTGENADPRGAAVEFFCNLLAELRSKGQGFLIADQIPSKLAPDLIKNTNVKIVHRTVDREDRELMGGAMHMTDEQTDYLALLNVGEAAIYSEGDNRPKLVKPPYAGVPIPNELRHVSSEKEVLARTAHNGFVKAGRKEYRSLTDVNTRCRRCTPFCHGNPDKMISIVGEEAIKSLINNEVLKPKHLNGNLIFDSAQFSRATDELVRGRLGNNDWRTESLRRCIFYYVIERWGLKKSEQDILIDHYFRKTK